MTEEVTGIDLVREQLRIADGEELGYADPAPIAALDRVPDQRRGRGPRLPARPRRGLGVPATVGPGRAARLRGVESGDVIGGAFDSMLAKLIVTGRDRQQALERSRRALAEFVVEGMPTVLPFHRAVVSDAAFAPEDPEQPFSVHTRWIETEFDNTIPRVRRARRLGPRGGRRAAERRRRGRRQAPRGRPARRPVPRRGWRRPRRRRPSARAAPGPAPRSPAAPLTAPMQGTIVKIAVEEGQSVEAGDLVVVLEAMKMEQPITAHKAGTVTGLKATVGQTVSNGAVIADIAD